MTEFLLLISVSQNGEADRLHSGQWWNTVRADHSLLFIVLQAVPLHLRCFFLSPMGENLSLMSIESPLDPLLSERENTGPVQGQFGTQPSLHTILDMYLKHPLIT